MKIKIGVIRETLQAVGKLLEEGVSANNYFKVKKLFAKMVEDAKLFEETRLNMCKKYSEKDKDGNPVMENGNFKIANIEQFNKEMQELINNEVEYEFEPIPISEAGEVKLNLYIEPLFKE